MLGKKPKRMWVEAKARWLTEMGHKRSICDDIRTLDWLHPHLDKMALEDITKDVIEDIAAKKEATGVTPSTVNRVLALIRSVLNRACKAWEWIEKVPHVHLRKENDARIRWLTRLEAERLLAQLPIHLRAMAKFTLATGLRAMNVSYLKWSEIDLETSHAWVHPDNNKSKKYLGVPLNLDALDVLEGQRGKHDKYVFVYKGKPVTQCSTRAWRLALKRAEIENFRWHDLRHTWASWHVQSGTSLQELCELGGWASYEMVLRYAHLSTNHLKKAADRIKI